MILTLADSEADQVRQLLLVAVCVAVPMFFIWLAVIIYLVRHRPIRESVAPFHPRVLTMEQFIARLKGFDGGQIFEYVGEFELCIQIAGMSLGQEKVNCLRVQSLWTAKRQNFGTWTPQFLYEGTKIPNMYLNEDRYITLDTAMFFDSGDGSIVVIDVQGRISVFFRKSFAGLIRPADIAAWEVIEKDLAKKK
jgi:hypothetical protein